MRPQLPEKTKQEIVRLWLLGLPRDEVASRTNTSGGSVNNVVDRWKEDWDRGDADALRILGKSIHASGISPSGCATGARITNLLTEKGLNADKAEQFLSTTYKKCENLGIASDNVVSHITDLTEFSDKLGLLEIEPYIKQKTSEKEQLDKQICEKEERVHSLRHKVKELEERLDRIYEEQEKAGDDFRLFAEAKEELGRLNLPINDVPKFAKAVKSLVEYGYRPDWIIAKVYEMLNFEQNREGLNVATKETEKKYNYLTQQNAVLQYQINLHSEELRTYKILENHGLGRWQLETLLRVIADISVSNGVPYWQAIGKFFNDIRTQYNSKVGFESKLEDLKFDIQIISEEMDKRLEDINYIPSVYITVNQLYSLGLKGNDILRLGQIWSNILNKTYSMKDLSTVVT